MQRTTPVVPLVLAALALVLVSATSPTARTWYIKPDGSGDAPTIQAGIDSAATGDEVLVACGTYYEHDIAMKSGITLVGEAGDPDFVIIDAYVEYPGTAQGILCVDLDASSTIQGVTIAHGFLYEGTGAGIYCASSDLSILNCAIVENHMYGGVGYGAGLYCADSNPSLADCTFKYNGITFAGHYGQGHGGGVFCSNSSPVFTDCLFENNIVRQVEGSGAEPPGGAVYSGGGAPEFVNCDFIDNAAGQGGAVFISGGAPSFYYCTFTGNIGSFGASALDNSGFVIITNCTFARNEWGFWGCIANRNTMSLINTIVAFSVCSHAVGGTSPNVQCCNVFGNEWGDWIEALEGLEGFNGNFGAWPLFCDPDSRNYALSGASPCLPENNPCGVLIGAHAQGCGPIALFEKSWGTIKSLYR
jgi:hypothetical protein